MTSKKYKFLFAGVFMLLATGAFAQSGSGYDVYDSSVITTKRMPQQNEFWNNTYNFPSKPRNMWEVGVSAGNFHVAGDVSSRIPTLGFAAHVRKALGYVFSLRLQYLYGNAKGLNWLQSRNFGNNPAWNTQYSAPYLGGGTTIPGRPADVVYYNYKNKTQDLGIQGIFTLNNIRFHKNKSGFVLYGGAGVGATAYQVKINALDENGNPYYALFSSIAAPTEYKDKKDILKALKDGLDDSYETDAENHGPRRPKLGDNTLRLNTTLLAGVAIKLGKRMNLAIENRHTFVKDDLMDGQQWQEHPYGDAAQTGNWDSYNYLSVGLNFNLGAKAVEPLWWLNPLDYAYSELNNPRHMKLPKPVLDDADGDGVTDQFDREPNTPAGAPVDTHGVSKDTDGDGVPDYKDKQLITPTECQPVDADGVGKCPEPECCKNMVPGGTTAQCPSDYPSVSFRNGSASLSSDAKAMLASTAAKLKANAACTVTVNGYPEASKASQANCQKRVDAIKAYLVETEGISADRISTNCEIGGGDKNTVDIKSN
ncbi:MAG TPA: OmpA family protein [Ferruginibacter sp.]|nr:OmpA family protein [Ferruginibacter sp.]HRE63100.1 OmpA family protein [Ferruginibacter sp.]